MGFKEFNFPAFIIYLMNNKEICLYDIENVYLSEDYTKIYLKAFGKMNKQISDTIVLDNNYNAYYSIDVKSDEMTMENIEHIANGDYDRLSNKGLLIKKITKLLDLLDRITVPSYKFKYKKTIENMKRIVNNDKSLIENYWIFKTNDNFILNAILESEKYYGKINKTNFITNSQIKFK